MTKDKGIVIIPLKVGCKHEIVSDKIVVPIEKCIGCESVNVQKARNGVAVSFRRCELCDGIMAVYAEMCHIDKKKDGDVQEQVVDNQTQVQAN